MLAWLARKKQNILTPQPCLHTLMQTLLSANQSAYYFSYFIKAYSSASLLCSVVNYLFYDDDVSINFFNHFPYSYLFTLPFFYPAHSFVHRYSCLNIIFCTSAHSLETLYGYFWRNEVPMIAINETTILDIKRWHDHIAIPIKVDDVSGMMMAKKCAAHSEFLFCLLNLLLFIFSCFHCICGWASLLVTLPSKTMAAKQQFHSKTDDLMENAW